MTDKEDWKWLAEYLLQVIGTMSTAILAYIGLITCTQQQKEKPPTKNPPEKRRKSGKPKRR